MVLRCPARPAPGLLLVFVATLAAAFTLSGCDSNDPPGPGTGPVYSQITIAGPDTLLIDSTAAFTVMVLDSAGMPVADPQLSWSTSSAAIATVNSQGVVRGVSEGDVVIRATGGGETSNSVTVAVIPGYGWVDQSEANPSLLDLRGVHFVTNRVGWIVGDLGTILKTTDAGRTWVAQNSGSTGYTLNAVWFTSLSDGYVVGSAGRLLVTRNGGVTWAPLAIDTDGGRALNHVYFQDADRGWIVGNGGLILRSQGAGGFTAASWQRVLPGVTVQDLERVSFPLSPFESAPPLDPYGYGWIVGAAGTILSSRDFGMSWSIVPPILTDPLFGVVRRSRTAAIAVGANDRVLLTVAEADSARWILAVPPIDRTDFEAVAWPGASGLPVAAWAVGTLEAAAQPSILRSDDGGATWTRQDLPADAPLTGNGLNDVFFLDDLRGWAVGDNGLILHTVTGGR